MRALSHKRDGGKQMNRKPKMKRMKKKPAQYVDLTREKREVAAAVTHTDFTSLWHCREHIYFVAR